MSLTSGFYNSISGDRAYNAAQLSGLFEGIITDGIFMSIGDSLMVSQNSGMTVSVGTGRAWFHKTWTNSDSAILLTFDPSEVVLNRIDRVVIEINTTDEVRANSIKIIKGSASSSPIPPTLISSDYIHQYPLADVYIGAGVSTITQSNITNKVGTSDCPFISGVLESINTDTLLTQWFDQFNTWFSNLQDILDENTEANLLSRIEAAERKAVAMALIFSS